MLFSISGPARESGGSDNGLPVRICIFFFTVAARSDWYMCMLMTYLENIYIV